ncbi:MAG: LysM peptidoglycan-binding domain-containing protein [Anaerolineae bacterium]|nr:LysM peptidoglycan-binding domain-containing protein [Anaerolineae bacterium]
MRKHSIHFSLLMSIILIAGSGIYIRNVSAAAAPPGQSYIVRPGDSLSKLAQIYLGSGQTWPEIVTATQAKAAEDSSFSPITNPNVLRVGQKLWIPKQFLQQELPVTDVPASFSEDTGPPVTYWGDVTYERRAADHFAAIRPYPLLLANFLAEMPKGADLHIHLSGAIYAESYIEWGAEDGFCVDTHTWIASAEPCGTGEVPFADVLNDSVLYRQIVDAWSMRNYPLCSISNCTGNNGHDHFFDTFSMFGDIKDNRTGDMIAEVTQRAAAENLYYLELMLTLSESKVRNLGETAWVEGDFAATRQNILDKGLRDMLPPFQEFLNVAEAKWRELLKCDSGEADPGCEVEVRYIHQVNRLRSPQQIFADMLVGFELMQLDPRVVALNLVSPEDYLVARRDYSLHMDMLNYLHSEYPSGNITLHAGELTVGLVPPEDLDFHIREAVEVAHAQRIGHGIDLMYEDYPFELLATMAEYEVMVEICLTSNDVILGVRGSLHPLYIYMNHDVPVALGTDDPGVSRGTMTTEYQKATEEQNLDYVQLKTMARTSLEYAFVEGAGLWKDFDKLAPVEECAGDPPGVKQLSDVCQEYLDKNLKADLQWELEQGFWKFEGQW